LHCVGGATPFWGDNIEIHLQSNVHELLLEVFDRDDVEATDIIHDEFMCSVKVDIREWIANKRFEGELNLLVIAPMIVLIL
jgi:hypothetical protein